MKQRRIEILILLFTLVLIVGVATIGSFTFSNLKQIEKHSEKIYEPNQTVINLKLLLGELRNSENCVRAYTLYKNDEYLQAYEKSLEEIDRCFDSLYNYQKNDTEAQELLDSTERLVEQKILLLNKHLSLRNESKVVNQVNRIQAKLDQVATEKANNPATADTVHTPEKKRSLLSRLFHRKENKTIVQKPEEPKIELNKESVDGIRSEVAKVKNQQSRMLADMNNKALELMKEDRQIWAKLMDILNVLENRQNQVLKEIASASIAQTEKTHKLTLLSGIMILIMLTFLAFLSIYYFYSEQKHRARLNKAVTESRMLAKARETFLATMSHEMRTPLNAIIGFTEQLSSTPLNEEQKKELEIINSASKHLLGLVNDVLDLSKIEAEKITFEKIEFSPKDQVTEAVEFFKPKIHDKHLECTLQFEKDIPASLIGDPLRLKQVILNLLSNSVKFTSSGGVHVRVSAQVPPHDVGVIFIHVSVEDTGIGISKDMVDKVFDNFVQADSSINRKFGGTGLGLSITKKIIELQGGNIKVESTVGKGTKISFRIPYRVNSAKKVKKEIEEEKYVPTIAIGKKVLIADDESFNRALLITILKRWNIAYDEAENGRQVLEKLEKEDYDIILMDVRMPEISGIDASRLIRKLNDASKSRVPIVALTAAVSDEKRRECLNAGMNDLLTKPYKEAKLLKIIEQTIKNTRADEKI